MDDYLSLVLAIVAIGAWYFGRSSGRHEGRQEAAGDILWWISENPPPGGPAEEWEQQLGDHCRAKEWLPYRMV